jgi:hypothetical protein
VAKNILTRLVVKALRVRFKEHQPALIKGKTTTLKLVEHAWIMGHIFEFDRAKPIGRERLEKARKCRDIEIYLDGQNVVSAPSMDLDPVWFFKLNELKVVRNKKMNTAIKNTLRPSVKTRGRLSRDDLKTVEDTASFRPPPPYMTVARRGALHIKHSQSSFAPC